MKTYTAQGDPRDLALLKVNARTMRPEMFAQLVLNIKRDGGLTQYPFVWRDENDVRHVLSGNHRVKAAIAAGLDEITWIETDDPLTEQQRIAVQVSHNSIAGEDEVGILRHLVEELSDSVWADYAAINDAELAAMAQEEPDLPEVREEVRGDTEDSVRLRDIFGTSALPVGAAQVVRQALDRMLERDDLSSKAKWRALEFWASDYLAGA